MRVDTCVQRSCRCARAQSTTATQHSSTATTLRLPARPLQSSPAGCLSPCPLSTSAAVLVRHHCLPPSSLSTTPSATRLWLIAPPADSLCTAHPLPLFFFLFSLSANAPPSLTRTHQNSRPLDSEQFRFTIAVCRMLIVRHEEKRKEKKKSEKSVRPPVSLLTRTVCLLPAPTVVHMHARA